MTTSFYPDISSHQAPPDVSPVLSLQGAHAICVKASEGETYVNPYYGHWKDEAVQRKIPFFAYHMLHHGNAAAQAAHCFSVVGKVTGLMLDVEPTTNSNPTLFDEAAFVDAYRKLGGICWLDYLPEWYWQDLGAPSMEPLTSRGLRLVSSAYPAGGYSADGEGWQPYGGRTPLIWQYTDKQQFNGHPVDFNAYKGPVPDLMSIVTTGKLPPGPTFTRHVVAAGNSKTLAQIAKDRHTTVSHITQVSRAHLSDPEQAVYDTWLRLREKMKTAKMPDPILPEGFAYCTTHP